MNLLVSIMARHSKIKCFGNRSNLSQYMVQKEKNQNSKSDLTDRSSSHIDDKRAISSFHYKLQPTVVWKI